MYLKSQSTPNKTHASNNHSQKHRLALKASEPPHTPYISSSKNLINVRAPDTPSPIKG